MNEDFIKNLLEAISPTFGGEKFLVEIPDLSVDERERERLAYRNESTLYKRKCDLSGKDIVSTFHEDVIWPVYSQEAYWSDKWDAHEFAREFDFSRSFFEQFKDLSDLVPRLAIGEQAIGE